jgi:hypothetical protein
MKIVLKLLLLAAAAVLVVMCYQSIRIPVEFKEVTEAREAVVIQRLKDVRTLQEAHRDKYQTYAATWDELVRFAKNDSLPIVQKIGSLTDYQLADGLNEKDAWMYLQDPKKYSKEIEKFGLDRSTFSRDTIYVNVLQKDSSFLSRPDFNIDSIKYVPFSQNRDTFELIIGSVETASGYVMQLFEAKAEYSTYLSDLNEQELANKIDDKKSQDKYPGLKVGDAEQANNNAGNWE